MGLFGYTYHSYLLNEIWLYSISNQVYLITLLLVFSLVAYLFLKNRETKPFELSPAEQSHYLNAIVDFSKVASLITDEHHRVRLANIEFLQLFDLTSGQIDYKNISDIPLPTDLVSYIRDTDEGERTFEKGITDIAVNVFISSIISTEGKNSGKFIQIQSKDQLSHTLEHDIKTPMNAIVGYSNLLKDEDELSSQQKKYLSIIQKQAIVLRDSISSIFSNEEPAVPEYIPFVADANPVKHILIVDDVSINRTFLRIMLTRRGFTISEAEDGEEAVQKFKELNPDLILMDISMPVKDGIMATREIRNLSHPKRGIPIVAVTANSFLNDRNPYHENGFNALLIKPFKEQELLTILNRFNTALRYP